MHFDEHFVKGVLPEATILYDFFPKEVAVSVDSRTTQPGDMFVALQGENVDGHSFLAQALESGAKGFVIDKEKKYLLEKLDVKKMAKTLVLAVTNTKQALLKLASAWRAQFTYPVVAVTGSVGKTSTKEIIANILTLNGSKFVASRGTQNTNIGVAMNMLAMRNNHEMAIFEVGISKRGEMEQLAKLVQPTTAVITSVGHSHMEGLGSLQDIAHEKRNIFKYFSEDSIGIINGDQAVLSAVGYSHPVVRFGSKTTNQIQARKIHIGSAHSSFNLKLYKDKYHVVIKQSHEGAVFNALAAAAVTHFLGIDNEIIVKGIQLPLVIAGRFEECRLKRGNGTLINDCYNANPESMKAALASFQKIDTKSKKIAVLGDMLELGVNSPFWHRQIGRFLRKASTLNHIILVGSLVKWTKKTLPVGVGVDVVADWQEAADKLQEHLDGNSVVLVKGSQGMQLDRLVKQFVQ